MRRKIITGIFICSILACICCQDCLGQGQKESEFSCKESVSFADLKEEQVGNLAILCKFWGLVKYKHEEVVNGAIDWDRRLCMLLSLVHEEDFQQRLLQLLPKIDQEKLKPINTEFHKFLSFFKENELSKELVVYAKYLMGNEVSENQQYLEPGQWGIAPKFVENDYSDANWKDSSVRLLTLFRYWNIIEYFFPYKEMMTSDWDMKLLEYIPDILNVQTEIGYKLLILKLVCNINDGHAGVFNDTMINEFFGRQQLPLEVKIFDDRLFVVSDMRPSKEGFDILPGDEILQIGQTSIPEFISRNSPYISSSTDAAHHRLLAESMLRTNLDSIEVLIEREHHLQKGYVTTVENNPIQYVQKSKASHSWLADDIMYIYPGSLQANELDSILQLSVRTKAIILDYRSYPSANVQNVLPNFLLPYARLAFKSTHYSINPLGHFYFTEPYPWGDLNRQYYKGTFIILVNEYTQSQPEFEILIYQKAPQTIVIGSSTAGTVGNWTPIDLPGGMLTAISGNGIYTIDDGPVQRLGILPDIYVETTIEGLKQGKDEILVSALQYCKSL